MWHKKDIRTIICRIYEKRCFRVPLPLGNRGSGIFMINYIGLTREKRQTICKLPGMWQAPDEMSGTVQYRYNLRKVQQGDCCHCRRRESYGSGKPENSREE